MLDAISGGRSEVGFGRAFLPREFARFKESLDESRARFEEGVEQVRRLLEEEMLLRKENATPSPMSPLCRDRHSSHGLLLDHSRRQPGVIRPSRPQRVRNNGYPNGWRADGGANGYLP